MRVLTVLGTRPEVIRLSRVIPLLDRHAEHVLVHTGQNFDDRLDGLFFRELGVRLPDVRMGVRSPSFGGQIGAILEKVETILLDRRPDRVLVLGDTNSGLVAIVARRLGIPVYHMEAGNRCYDDRVPEEVNRRVIDHSSTILMPYTERSRENLLREGFASDRVFVTGNPIKQVIDHYTPRIAESSALADLGLEERKYFLVTMHRAENVDDPDRLRNLIDGISRAGRTYGFPVVCSLHPRTRSKIEAFAIDLSAAGVRFLEPLGFFDFIRLEQGAFCVLTDSGTVQEETCIFRTPAVTIRDVTERPETIESGSNILAGAHPDSIVTCVEQVTASGRAWEVPREYMVAQVAETVAHIVLGYRLPDPAEEVWLARSRR